MPVIKPISDLRNRARELSRTCHASGEPIFITKNGRGDMVLMSLAAFERLQAQLDLYRLLDGRPRSHVERSARRAVITAAGPRAAAGTDAAAAPAGRRR